MSIKIKSTAVSGFLSVLALAAAAPLAHADANPALSKPMEALSGHYVLVEEKVPGCDKLLSVDAHMDGKLLVYQIGSVEGYNWDSKPMKDGYKRTVIYGADKNGAPFVTLKDSLRSSSPYDPVNDRREVLGHTTRTNDFRLVSYPEKVLIHKYTSHYSALYYTDGYTQGSGFFPSDTQERTCRYVEVREQKLGLALSRAGLNLEPGSFNKGAI